MVRHAADIQAVSLILSTQHAAQDMHMFLQAFREGAVNVNGIDAPNRA